MTHLAPVQSECECGLVQHKTQMFSLTKCDTTINVDVHYFPVFLQYCTQVLTCVIGLFVFMRAEKLNPVLSSVTGVQDSAYPHLPATCLPCHQQEARMLDSHDGLCSECG